MNTQTAKLRKRQPTRYVCPLALADEQPGCGGKARNLARMLRLGLTVPAGLVVANSAFQEFLDQQGLRPLIDVQLAAINWEDPVTLGRAARAIREAILRSTIPADIWEEIQELLAEILAGTTLIVRSSAIGEDTKDASFAGQLDSILHVDSERALQQALLACWASYWSERSLFYQHSRGVTLTGMGVIIQAQVDSRLSGVLFTQGPTSPGEMLVEYCVGHGDELVGGRINPHRVALARDRLEFRALENHGQDAKIGAPALAELARHGLKLERELGGPQDIEWTIGHDDRLYLVQSRPITVPLVTLTHPRTRLVRWSNANVNENFPDPVCPLLYSIAAEGFYHYFRNLGRAFGIARWRIEAMEQPLRHLVGVHGARLYYNLTNIHAVLRQAPFGDVLAEFFNSFVGVAGLAERNASPRKVKFSEYFEVLRLFCSGAWQFLGLSRRVEAFERTVTEFAAGTRPDELDQKALSQLLDDFRRLLDIRFNRWKNASLADAAAMLSYGALKRFLSREFPDEDLGSLHNTLLKGLRDVVSSEPIGHLWELSRKIRTQSDWSRAFALKSSLELWTEIDTQPDWSAIRQELLIYLDRWGFRCSGELMLTVPGFQEEPWRLLDVLKAYVEMEGESPEAVLRRQEFARGEQTACVRQVLSKRWVLRWLPWPRKSSLLALLLSWTQRAISLRERARLHQALLYSRCRRIALAIGKQLADHLNRPDDVFFLTHQELDRRLSGADMFPYRLRELIELRRAEHDELSALQPPDDFELEEGFYLDVTGQKSASSAACENNHMTGTGACGGVATGPAAVLRDISEMSLLHRGDVLVTRQTDPGWGPVFFLIKGLVMERGGMLSHGAILAREYGIPTVVAVSGATQQIAPGQMVAVNGDRGCVEIVD